MVRLQGRRNTAEREGRVPVRAPLENLSPTGALPRGRHVKDTVHEALSILPYALDLSLVSGNEA